MGENIPTPDYTTYINTSNDSSHICWKPMDYSISNVIITADDINRTIERINKLEEDIKIKKENNKMNFEEILEIYKCRKEKEYQKNFDKESLKLAEKDEIIKIIKKAENEINTKFIKEFEDEVCLGRFATKETLKKREEIKAEFNKKYCELAILLEEVKAQLKAIPNDDEWKYQNAIEILKAYEILDEKGKINA